MCIAGKNVQLAMGEGLSSKLGGGLSGIDFLKINFGQLINNSTV